MLGGLGRRNFTRVSASVVITAFAIDSIFLILIMTPSPFGQTS